MLKFHVANISLLLQEWQATQDRISSKQQYSILSDSDSSSESQTNGFLDNILEPSPVKLTHTFQDYCKIMDEIFKTVKALLPNTY